ncbi:MAG: ACT domain-containing protein [Candidatus Methanomethylophilaceae archaeon]|nr:ACT domain-containing protein [Candidatus Methanomethylophilaceae archaeon]
MEKTVITLIGKDTVGIIAKVCTYFANNGINILDIAQTTVRDFINMMMVIDTSTSKKSVDEISKELDELSKSIGCVIHAYGEDNFGVKE